MSNLRILELTSSLTSTTSDPRLQLQTVETLVKAVRSEGFARLQLNTGVKVTKEKSFPSLFTPLVQGLLKLLSSHDTPASGGSGGGSGDVSLQFSKNISQILYLLCRANKSFSRWVYTVPKFVAIYLRAIRALQVTDIEISMRLLKTLQHILSLERKAALVVRLEGGIKTLMQCIGNGGGSSATLNNRRNDPNAGVQHDSGISQAVAFSNAVAASNTSSSSASSSSTASTSASSASSLSTTSTVHQKFLRILIEVLLVVLKHNEHNSTAIVTQSLPYLSNLLHVLRNQQGHVKIFSHALQILERLCKEKKIINALLGTPPPSAVPKGDTAEDDSQPTAAPVSSALLTALPPNSPAVQALLAVLGPNVNSFMTWCMLTLLNNKFESATPVLNVLLRLIFQLASSKIGFTTLLANGGVEALLPAIQSQLHKRATVRATTALIWQSQRQQYGHLVPKIDPLYKFHEAGLKVFFTADGRVLKEAEWEAERAVLKAKKAAAAAALATSSSTGSIPPEGATSTSAAELEADLENEATAIEATEELDDAEEITTVADDETSLAAGEPAVSGSPPIDSFVNLSPAASSNDFAASPTTIVPSSTEFLNDDESGGGAGEDGDNDNERAGGERAQAGSDEDEADEGDEAGAKSGASDSEADDLESGDEAPKPKKKVTVIKKTAEPPVIQTALPTPVPSNTEIERVKALLLQTIAAAATPVSQININPDGTAAISPVPSATSSSAVPSTAPSTSNSPAPAAPKLGLSLDDQTLGWNCSPELWDPEDPETAKRIAANLDEVKHAQYNAPKSVSPFIMPTPYLPYYEDERGRRVPGVLQQNKNEPLLETNPSILIEKMLQSTQRFTHPASFMGRVVYDKDAGGSLLHLLPPTPTTSDSNNSSVSPPPGSSPIVTSTAPSPALPSPSSSPTPKASPSRSPAASKKASATTAAAKNKDATTAAAASAAASASASKLGVEGSRKILSAGRTAALKAVASTSATKTVTSSSSSSGSSTPASPASGLKRRATAPASRSSGKTPLTPVAPSSNSSMRVGSASAISPSPLIISNTISSSPIPSPSLASRTNRASATFSQQQQTNSMPVPPLHFESRFEGGNLHRVVQVSETTYDLVLSTDVNSRGHTQWFFFQIKHAVPNVTYQFNMLNLEKNHSTFNTGMKPVMFSAKMYEQNKIGWHRAMNVDEVAYYHSFHRRPYDEASGKLKIGTDKQNVNEDDEDGESGAEGAADGEDEEGTSTSKKKQSKEDDATGTEKPKKKLLKKKVIVKKKLKKAESPDESPARSRSRSISPMDDSAPPVRPNRALQHSPVRSTSSSVTGNAGDEAAAVQANEEQLAASASSTASTDSLASEIRALKLQNSEAGAQSVPVTSRASSAAGSSGSATARVTSPNAPTSGHSGLIEFDMTAAPKKKILKKKVGTKGKLSARGSKDKDATSESTGGVSSAPKKKKKILVKKGKGKPTSDCFYTLTFSIRFPHADDTILLAYHYPFTYSFQRECLDHLYQTTSLTNQCLRRQKLCSTRGGNCCEVLTITEFARSKFELDAVRKRKLVFLSARIHPGECNSSWVMKGLLEFLTSKDETAVWLRNNMVFKIVPMLNIDGVIEGNHRTSLSGVDLNRHWDEPSPIIHPTLYYTRKLLLALAVNRSLLLYCDFHGHSAMKNMCLYGCDMNKSEGGLGPFPLQDQLHFKHIQEALTLSPEAMSVVTGVTTNSSSASIAGGSAASAAALLRSNSLNGSSIANASKGAGANNSGSVSNEGMFAASLNRRSTMPAAPYASPNFDASAMTVPSNPFASLPPTLTPNALAVLAAPLVVEYRAGHVFPELLARRPEVGGRYFNHAACAFHVRKDKAGTARVVFWRALRHWDVFTFEASFAGGTLGDMKNQHFQPWHYEDMGLRFLETLKELHRLRKEKQQLIQQFVTIEQNKPSSTGPSNVPNSPPNVVVASSSTNV